MLPEQFAIIGSLISFTAAGIYLFGTIKGTVKPNRVTFFLWALAPLIAFSAQISQGVGIQALITFSVGFGPILILAASFLHKNKNATWKLGRFDYACGALSVGGLILWQITQVGNIAILFSIIADTFAAIPTIVKSYKAPETESPISYILTSFGGLLTFFTITQWNFETYAFPLYIILINLLIFVVLRFKLNRRLSH